MSQASKIEWTEATWNPIAGCTPVSPGCLNCYAARMALRLERMSPAHQTKYAGTARRARDGRPVFSGRINLDYDALRAPERWRKPRVVFVNSMSDLFHEDVPFAFMQEVFAIMVAQRQHTFQVLTKRPAQAAGLASELPWPANVWLGTSVELEKYYDRIHALCDVPAHVRFLSCEPLLGPLGDLPLSGIHWVIVGGESGPGARPMRPAWVVDIRDQCTAAGVPFFFKQWGGANKKRTGRVLEGRTWDEMPHVERTAHAQSREATLR